MDAGSTGKSKHHQALVARTSAAIASLLAEGKRISFYAVAARAEIARSTLYRCDDLKQLVLTARDGLQADASERPVTSDSSSDEVAAKLRQTELERDILISALNELGSSEGSVAYQYAIVDLEPIDQKDCLE